MERIIKTKNNNEIIVNLNKDQLAKYIAVIFIIIMFCIYIFYFIFNSCEELNIK